MTRRRLTDPVTWIGVAIVMVLGAGSAVAATGGTFLLGKANSATTLTSLTNSDGTALKLTSKPGTPPLAVSNDTKVAKLNADELDGLSASQFQRKVQKFSYSPADPDENTPYRKLATFDQVTLEARCLYTVGFDLPPVVSIQFRFAGPTTRVIGGHVILSEKVGTSAPQTQTAPIAETASPSGTTLSDVAQYPNVVRSTWLLIVGGPSDVTQITMHSVLDNSDGSGPDGSCRLWGVAT